MLWRHNHGSSRQKKDGTENIYFYRWPVETKYKEILCNLFDLSALDILYKESLRCRSQIMPGRTFRRKKNKAIGRTHFNNKKVAF